jgi:alpha-mannosidase
VEFLLDKQSGARYSGLGNVVFNEIDDTGPYHFGPVRKTYRWTDAKLKSVVRGQLRSSFVLEGTLGPHYVQIAGHLYHHARRIGFETRINSTGGSGHFMTTVGLPSPGKLAADVHFGVEDRDLSRIAYKGEERLRKNVFYGDHWVDYNDGLKGLTVLGTTGEKGYQFLPEENILGHFLLMTIPPSTDWERLVTSARAGIGRHQFDYQFLLHSGDWNKGSVVRRALEARHPILPVFPDHPKLPQERTLPEEKSFLSLSPSTVQLSAFYRDGNRYLVRLYESAGLRAKVSIEFPFRVPSAEEVDFNGSRRGKSLTVLGSTIGFDIAPWEIVTVAVA